MAGAAQLGYVPRESLRTQHITLLLSREFTNAWHRLHLQTQISYVWILYPQLRQHGSASKGISGARLSLEGSRGRLQAPSHSHILFLSVHLEHRRNTTHRKPQQLHQHSVAHTVRQSGMTLPKFLLKSLVHSLRFGAVRMIV